MNPVRIVIIGGGFGGIRTALDLDKRLAERADITLIDRNSYHLFTPLLYEVASAYGISPDRFSVGLRKTISVPFADIFQNTHVTCVRGEVARVSLTEMAVTTRGDTVCPFDYLVLALGGQPADYGIQGIREYAYQFKTIEDALILQQRLAYLYERAARNELELPIRIVVGGGGFTGVELAAELAVTARTLGEAHRLPANHMRITLVEAGPKIMPNISDRERAVIVKRLTRLGVVIREQCGIEYTDGNVVRLMNGAMLAHNLLVWTGGIKACEFLKSISEIDLTPQGKVIVDEHLNTPRYPNVFAVGDIVEFIDHRTQKPEPALAYVAVQHGQIVAQNIERSMKGKELKVHKPFYDLWIAPIGGKYAVAHLNYGLRLRGLVGWLARGVADLKYFVSILSFRRALRLFREQVDVFVKND